MPKIVTYEDYLTAVDVYRVQYGNQQREGQMHFNVLFNLRPDLSEQVRSGPLDPFYNDELLPDFLAWVKDSWEEPSRTREP